MRVRICWEIATLISLVWVLYLQSDNRDLKEQNKLLRDIYKSLLEASRLKDNDTGNHIARVNSYARRMAEARVPTELTRYDGMIHGFFAMTDILDAARDAVARACRSLVRDLAV